MSADGTVIRVRGLVNRFGAQVVHDGLDLDVREGEILGVVGGSGSGKSVLMRSIIGLRTPDEGSIEVLGADARSPDPAERQHIERSTGVLFQDGALFSSLTVAANVEVPLRESGLVPEPMIAPLVALRLAQAGLPADAGGKMPSQLSGGMRKRAAIARALALEPEVLFLDEPTSGLDPITARAFDGLLRGLCDDLGITVVVVTHDLDTLLTIAKRIVVLGGGRVAGDGTPAQVMASDDPWIREYFSSRKMPAAEVPDGP